MLIVTTPSVEGKKIIAYHGVVVGCCEIRYGILYSYQLDVAKAEETASAQITKQAEKLGGNAIVGVTHWGVMGKEYPLFVASGTAVTLE